MNCYVRLINVSLTLLLCLLEYSRVLSGFLAVLAVPGWAGPAAGDPWKGGCGFNTQITYIMVGPCVVSGRLSRLQPKVNLMVSSTDNKICKIAKDKSHNKEYFPPEISMGTPISGQVRYAFARYTSRSSEKGSFSPNTSYLRDPTAGSNQSWPENQGRHTSKPNHLSNLRTCDTKNEWKEGIDPRSLINTHGQSFLFQTHTLVPIKVIADAYLRRPLCENPQWNLFLIQQSLWLSICQCWLNISWRMLCGI